MHKHRSRRPFAVHRMLDSHPTVAVVRYDGDPDVFTALAAAWLREEGISSPIAPPQPRLYRINPINDYEFSWTLGRPDRPGRGTFLGALIELAPWPEQMCVSDGVSRDAHDWSEWCDRPAAFGPPRPGQPARTRYCQHCGVSDTDLVREEVSTRA